MKILVLTDRFLPEISAPSFRIRDHARHWLAEGHEVTVVTCVPNFPRGKVFPGYQHKLYQEEWLNGVRVIRLGTYMTANEGFFKRTLDYVSFMVAAIVFAWKYPKFDVVLATSPPLFTAVAGRLVSLFRRRPWVFEIRDLWPESIKAVGASQSRMIDCFEKLELYLYRKAQRIVTVTRSFKTNLISRGIDGEKIDVVRNGVECDRFDAAKVTESARAKLGLSDDVFLAGYIGTVGMAQGLETLIEAAQLCREQSSMRFLIMGEGAERTKLETLVRELELTNVQFVDFAPQEELPQYLAALDVSIVHLRPDPLFKTVIPSKIFELMSMGVPILHAVEGESAEIVADAQAGLCIPSGDAEQMSRALTELAEQPHRLTAMRLAGQRAAREQHDREVHAQSMLVALQAAIDCYQGRSPDTASQQTQTRRAA